MRRKLGYLFVVVCAALLMLYFYRYKRAAPIEGKIPVSATEIVYVDVRQIEHHVLIDVLKNPLKYINFKRRTKEKESLRKAISIPQNLVFFTNGSSLKNAWFSSFIAVKNLDKLKVYLVQEGFVQVSNAKLDIFNKGVITIAISDENLVIALKKQQNHSVSSTMERIFRETNFHKESSNLLASISKSESAISYVNTASDFLEGNFTKGLFTLKGKVNSNLFLDVSYNENPESSVGFIATQINKKHPLFQALFSKETKKKFDNFTKLSLDSIVDKWNGNFVFNLKSVNKKNDTIVTYEYDDDFNKIEKKTIQNLTVPDLRMQLGEEDDLYAYFDENGAIKLVEGETLFTSIPLYKLYAKEQNGTVQILTSKEFGDETIKTMKSKFKAYVNLQKYVETPLEFPVVDIESSTLKQLNDVSVELSMKNEFSLLVSSKNNNRNFFAQFIKP